MNGKKSYKGKIFIGLALAAVLVFAYFADEQATPEPDAIKTETVEVLEVPKETQSEAYPENTETAIEEQPDDSEKTQKEAEAPVQKEAENPASEETPKEEKNELYCTLSVRCDTVFDNISRVSSETLEILPENSIIFAEQQVEFQEGESVFDVLLREMKNNGIHLEFVNTPVYNSVYIEGIGNLYEFDAGELSGWMYKVNGVFPNYGCSKYYLKKGDKVEFVYTCDLGKDVGNDYAGRQGGGDE